MKIQQISQNITPFAGISFINEEFKTSGLNQLIDNHLGIRPSTRGYRYSDIIRNYNHLFYCGGDCAEDIQQHLGKDLNSIPGNRVCSADTLLRGIKELTVENETFVSRQGKTYRFNGNEKLNRLNIAVLLHTKQLEKGKSYDFDYDNQIIATDKYDAQNTYKKTKGYCPGIGTIGDKVVYVEGRDGNANVKFEQAGTLERACKLLEDRGIKVYRSRMDAGSYAREIIDVVDEHSELFYIRAHKCENVELQIRGIENWTCTEINHIPCEVASIVFTQFFEERKYRLVVMREKTDNAQLNLFTGDNLKYRCILTNDWGNSEKEIITYYNARGGSERILDVMNNDFGWSHLPCSFLNENTAFMILTAIMKNIFNYIVEKFSKVFNGIKATMRMKRFTFRFISVAGKWVYSGRQWILKLYTDRNYGGIVT